MDRSTREKEEKRREEGVMADGREEEEVEVHELGTKSESSARVLLPFNPPSTLLRLFLLL